MHSPQTAHGQPADSPQNVNQSRLLTNTTDPPDSPKRIQKVPKGPQTHRAPEGSPEDSPGSVFSSLQRRVARGERKCPIRNPRIATTTTTSTTTIIITTLIKAAPVEVEHTAHAEFPDFTVVAESLGIHVMIAASTSSYSAISHGETGVSSSEIYKSSLFLLRRKNRSQSNNMAKHDFFLGKFKNLLYCFTLSCKDNLCRAGARPTPFVILEGRRNSSTRRRKDRR